MPSYIKSYNEELVEASSRFLEDCLSASPQRGFAHVFDRKNVETNSSLKDSFRDSLIEFETDLARWNWRSEKPDKLFERLLIAPTLLVVYFYRLSHALFTREIKVIPDVIAALSRWMTGAEIYYSAKIGPGLKVIHGLGTVIGAQCQIGSNFTIYQGVTIGDKLGKRTGLDQRPHIGDSVIACAGSAVLGPVYIGDKTIIGANSVVIDSLPGRCITTGPTAVVKVENLSDSEFEKFWTAIHG